MGMGIEQRGWLGREGKGGRERVGGMREAEYSGYKTGAQVVGGRVGFCDQRTCACAPVLYPLYSASRIPPTRSLPPLPSRPNQPLCSIPIPIPSQSLHASTQRLSSSCLFSWYSRLSSRCFDFPWCR